MITFLAPELKIKIFDYLNAEELRVAATVCENWREVICSSKILMAKFQYKIINYADQKVFISYFGGYLPKIRIQGNYKSTKVFKEMLTRIHHVRELEFRDVDIVRPKADFYMDIHLPVKHLKLIGTSNTWKITNFLNSADLRSLELIVVEYISAFNFGYFGKHFIKWLIMRKKLESMTLSLNCCILHKLFPNNDLTFYAKFLLKRLILNLEGNVEDPDTKWIFWKFFICQIGLEELQLFNIPYSIRKSVYKHSFFDFEHLTTLKMVAADISEEVLCLPFSNPNLTTLVFIDKGLQGEPAFRRVVKFFPNLKVLEYFSSHPKSGSFLKYLADNLLQLECLRTDLVESGSDFCRLQFNTLKQVAFDGCIMNPEEWNCFVLDNPLVEKLSLNSFVLPAESIACISHYWRQLKEIELGFGCYTADLMHEIADNCLNLKHLKITKEMAVQFKDILAMRAPGIHTFTDDNHFGDNQSFVMNYFLMRKSHAYQTMLNNYNVLAPIWYEDHISSDEAEEGSNGRISSTASVDGAMKYYTEDELLFYNEELDGVVKMDYEIEELSI